ncbi:DUF1178 family protein [Pararobbsia alpina]|uniref:Uncharacterized protein n=1 Tax=Pararobbsia alpina TaxID=621374 RepID=A0A6S7CR86_9BURK|nr:DUF1178 family protein [Pararobbsia alpina]CAB3785918.1 hypothetical protein LMG28138_02090 [Pararobbsia alpina]
MKVFDLRCADDHRFEGWFGSDADYESQHAKRMIGCPICGSVEIDKLPSAPRLNLSGATAPAGRGRGTREEGREAHASERAAAQQREQARDETGDRERRRERDERSERSVRDARAEGRGVAGSGHGVPAPSLPPEALHELQRQFMQAARELIAKTENVGDRFAEEARKIHYDEAPARGIRGVASAEETRELIEEGIEVIALPIPASLEGPLQ